MRKIVSTTQDVLTEGGSPTPARTRQTWAAAVLGNPWAGTPTGIDLGAEAARVAPILARGLTARLLVVAGGPEAVRAFGKAAIVGLDGEIEHGGALIHTPYFGNLVREFTHGSSIICFADDRADAGHPLAVPMWHKTAAATRDYYQTTNVRIADAPLPDEIVIIVALSTGPRPHARIGDRTTDPTVVATSARAR